MSKKQSLLPSLLPILKISKHVLLPGASLWLHVNDPRGLHLVETYLWNDENWRDKYIGIVPQEPGTNKLHSVGVASRVSRITARSHPQAHFMVFVTGLCRFRINEISQEVPYIIASITQLDYLTQSDEEISPSLTSLTEKFKLHATELLEILQQYSPTAGKLRNLLDSLPDHSLPDIFTSIIQSSQEEKLQVLDAKDLNEVIRLALPLLLRQIETLRLLGNTRQLSDAEPDQKHKQVNRVWKVRQKPPLSLSGQEEDDEMIELERRIHTSKLPPHAMKVAVKELKRLTALPSQFPEHAVIRSYLETLLDLPWNKTTTDKLDIKKAREDLDYDHYGLESVKKRILEYLAVRKLKNSLKGPILCLVGAPGVGKTSIGRSVAHTMGRKFYRLSLGGICDQSDIRGHRRTYIGSMLGGVLQALKTIGVCNPVILLDEVDKLNKGIHGDPSAALLEVLDPEQNHTFTDHYLGIPFDLSKVLFIATANTTSSIPSPLLDRMEVIRVAGYTLYEKIEIAIRHLIPKLLQQHGLKDDQLKLSPSTIQDIVCYYTREAGVRELERKLSAICRGVAIQVVEGNEIQEITKQLLEDILGPWKYDKEVSERLTTPGVAVGLAWTVSGGDILFVEACLMPGTGELILTGQLGDVMKESAQIALNWLRSHSAEYDISCDPTDHHDIHIHFPAGAVEKDGPSAGVTIVTVLASLYTGRCVRSDTAMTGEVTLRGSVLAVGGIKEKVLAAHRAGISHIILPKKNEKDLQDLPSNVKDDLSFTLVQNVRQVLEHAFDGGFTPQENSNVISFSKL